MELSLRSVTGTFTASGETRRADPGKTWAQQKQPSLVTSDFVWRSDWKSSGAMMLLTSLREALAPRDALPPSMSVSSVQHGIRYARSKSVKTKRNTTRPRSMYSFLVSPFASIESPTVPQAIVAINPSSKRQRAAPLCRLLQHYFDKSYVGQQL
jgi:hypothetical protein